MSSRQRIDKTNNILNDFIMYDLPNIKFEEINILINGESLNNTKKEIDFNLPTFQINFFEIINDNYSPIFITADGYYFEKFKNLNYPYFYISPGIKKNNEIVPKIKKEYNKTNFRSFECNYEHEIKNKLEIIYKHKENLLCHHKSNCENLQLGSALTCILFLSKISKKINIFGWDQYLKRPLTFNTFLHYKALFGSANNYRFDIYACFATAIFNFYYSSRLNKENVNIKSFISSIHVNNSILKKIEKIIYNI